MRGFDRRSVLVAVMMAALGSTAADAQWGEQRRYRHRRRGDHGCARRALEEGRAKPLAEILPRIQEKFGGQVIDIEVRHCTGRLTYEFKVLRPDGQLVEATVDALSGELIQERL